VSEGPRIEGPRTEEGGPAVDPAGEPVEDALPDEESSSGQGEGRSRFLDQGSIFAGWVGLGMALVIAIAFELIIAVQPFVFLMAPISGALIGYYANQRSRRWRPRWRLFVNAGYAGLVTGIGLAVMYIALRLLFVYADSGFSPEGQLGGQLECNTGPACTYMRFIERGDGPDLAASGITDAAAFETAVWRWQLVGGAWIIGMNVGGALLAAGVRSVRRPPDDIDVESRGVGAETAA
jgi:hypothetical protein